MILIFLYCNEIRVLSAWDCGYEYDCKLYLDSPMTFCKAHTDVLELAVENLRDSLLNHINKPSINHITTTDKGLI